MTTIYVVTSGEYSDYGIEAIFDTREKAELYCAYQNSAERGETAEIEEWELNNYYTPLQRGLSFFLVQFLDITKGDAEVVKQRAGEERESSYQNYQKETRNYSTALWAKDAQAALKIGNEKRVQYLLRLEQEEIAR